PTPAAEGLSLVPFGPIHPLLSHVFQLGLDMREENIRQAYPAFGYQYRGMHAGFEDVSLDHARILTGRICGKCSFSYGLALAMAIENISGMPVPERALSLRCFFAELERVSSHLLQFSTMAAHLGISCVSVKAMQTREKLLDICQAAGGSRLFMDACIPGGMTLDLPREMVYELPLLLDEVLSGAAEVEEAVLRDGLVYTRLRSAGQLSPEKVAAYGITGPDARASGCCRDSRTHGYAAYASLDFCPRKHTGEEDAMARMMVRGSEIYDSVSMMKLLLESLPAGPVRLGGSAVRAGLGMACVEQAEGELICIVEVRDSGRLQVHFRSPSEANMAGLLSLAGNSTWDELPVILDSFGICIPCFER
ncbi:MAG TPA: hypothetical protein DD727_01095, partial [Clostridiales bacterium]|nr:hypothetical protein [Clostridiales bacterium]